MGRSANTFQYRRLADELAKKIEEGVYRAGEKLPSLRTLRSQTGLSMTTVYHAYVELEERSLVEPRPKSGYYVKASPKPLLPPPTMQVHELARQRVTSDTMIYTLTREMADPGFLRLGGISVAPELLPVKALHREIKGIPGHKLGAIIASYADPFGNIELRTQIAKRMVNLVGKITPDQIVISNGCTEALSTCLRAVTKPGDSVIIESPCDPWTRQMIQDLDLFTLEVPTHPLTGMDLDSVQRALDTNGVSAVLSNPNFQNPLGFTMPDENKKRLVALCTQRQVPIIEDDIYGELYFGRTRPSSLKSFDDEGLVLYCSSFSKSLAAGLRVGWAVPGRFIERVQRLKLNLSVTSPPLNQYIVSRFMQGGAFERHLRRLRRALEHQIQRTAEAIADHFPAGTCMTRPRGGLFLWVELDKGVDGLTVYRRARQQAISILPGSLGSGLGLFDHFIRISCGYPWNERIEQGIVTLAKIIGET